MISTQFAYRWGSDRREGKVTDLSSREARGPVSSGLGRMGRGEGRIFLVYTLL